MTPIERKIFHACLEVSSITQNVKVLQFLPNGPKTKIHIQAITNLSTFYGHTSSMKCLCFQNADEYNEAIAFLKTVCHQNYDDSKRLWFYDIAS